MDWIQLPEGVEERIQALLRSPTTAETLAAGHDVSPEHACLGLFLILRDHGRDEAMQSSVLSLLSVVCDAGVIVSNRALAEVHWPFGCQAPFLGVDRYTAHRRVSEAFSDVARVVRERGGTSQFDAVVAAVCSVDAFGGVHAALQCFL